MYFLFEFALFGIWVNKVDIKEVYIIIICLISSWQERQVQSCFALCPLTSRLDNLWNFTYVRTIMLTGINVLSIINNHTISVSLHAWWLAACPHLLAVTAFISPHIFISPHLYCTLLSLPSRRSAHTHTHTHTRTHTHTHTHTECQLQIHISLWTCPLKLYLMFGPQYF